MSRRHYSDMDREAALASLAAHGGDLIATSRITGVPETTLRRWSAADPARKPALVPTPNARPPASLLPPDDAQALYDQLAQVARKVCDTRRARAADASFPELCTGLGVVIDRMTVLQTGRADAEEWTAEDEAAAELDDLSDDEYIECVSEILDAARARQAAARHGGGTAPASTVPDLAGGDLSTDHALGLASPAPPPDAPGPVDHGRDLPPHGLRHSKTEMTTLRYPVYRP